MPVPFPSTQVLSPHVEGPHPRCPSSGPRSLRPSPHPHPGPFAASQGTGQGGQHWLAIKACFQNAVFFTGNGNGAWAVCRSVTVPRSRTAVKSSQCSPRAAVGRRGQTVALGTVPVDLSRLVEARKVGVLGLCGAPHKPLPVGPRRRPPRNRPHPSKWGTQDWLVDITGHSWGQRGARLPERRATSRPRVCSFMHPPAGRRGRRPK